MSGKEYDNGSVLYVLWTAIVIALLVLSAFSVSAVKTAKKAEIYADAVYAVKDASAAFYKADSEDELAELLNAKRMSDGVLAAENGTVCISITRDNRLETALITAMHNGEPIYELSCVKAQGIGG